MFDSLYAPVAITVSSANVLAQTVYVFEHSPLTSPLWEPAIIVVYVARVASIIMDLLVIGITWKAMENTPLTAKPRAATSSLASVLLAHGMNKSVSYRRLCTELEF